MPYTRAQQQRPRVAWALLIAMATAAIGCFNGNGNGHGRWDRGPRGGRGGAVVPTAADLAEIRGRIQAAEAAVSDLPPQDQAPMRQAINWARSALQRYERLAAQGATRQRRTGQIYMAGGFVLANDATGVGTADDVLIPFLVLGLIATHLTTEAPAPPTDVAQAWGEVIAGLDAVGKAAEGIRAGQRVSPMPPMDHCTVHLQECLGTPLGNKNSGGKWGRSVCYDCWETCTRSKQWPVATRYGKSCEWWKYQ